jgi:hypothetical protein
MIKLFILIAIFFCKKVELQNISLLRFSAVNQVEIPEMTEVVTASHQNIEERENRDILCLYDFQGNRVNKECKINERPPRCEKGTLVQTVVGSDYEMCCRNFSVLM